MLLSFNRTLTALAEAIVRRKGLATNNEPDISGIVAAYLQNVHERSPDYLRLPFRVLTMIFDASSYFKYGKPFHALDGVPRIAQISVWERSRFETCRRLMEMYNSLALFCLYSELYSLDYDHGTLPER